MQKIYFSLFLLLLLVPSQQKWEVVDEWPEVPTDANLDGWEVTGIEPVDVTTQCGDKTIIGGFEKFNGVNLRREYQVKEHDQIRYQFDLWFLDNWLEFDSVGVSVDNNLFQVIKGSFPVSNLCGQSDVDDSTGTIGPTTLFHNTPIVAVNIGDGLETMAIDQSWGISNFKLEIQVPDDGEVVDPMTPDPPVDGELCVNGLCFDNQEDLQVCVQNLNQLSPLEKNNTSITNNCEPFVEDNIQKFFFSINYTEPFQFNEGCLDQSVQFEKIDLVDGEDYTFDGELQSLRFNVPLSDFDEKFNCERRDTDEKLVWFCKIQHMISFGDTPQLEYNFKIQVTIDKVKIDTDPIVTIQRNVVEGFCCDNELNVQTALEFCSDFECSSVLPSPLQVKRREDFFVRHKITSPEFQFLFLIGQQIRVGSFFPEIVNQRSDKGELVYHLRSDIAGNDFQITSIAQLSPTDETISTRLRSLQFTGEIRDDYKVRADGQMSIVGEEIQTGIEPPSTGQPETVVKTVEEKDNKNVLIGVIVGIGVLLMGSIIFGAIACSKQKGKQRREQEHLQIQAIRDQERQISVE